MNDFWSTVNRAVTGAAAARLLPAHGHRRLLAAARARASGGTAYLAPGEDRLVGQEG
ncbi:hypothetical protein ACIBQ6_20085 [Nonomuraea sp. NPDC049655]|uniref:hypothetical protein n=1 Tax=Nonomuraea sp. NPDC049655 TaxID=3364355 RepID=UPI0037BCAAFA